MSWVILWICIKNSGSIIQHNKYSFFLNLIYNTLRFIICLVHISIFFSYGSLIVPKYPIHPCFYAFNFSLQNSLKITIHNWTDNSHLLQYLLPVQRQKIKIKPKFVRKQKPKRNFYVFGGFFSYFHPGRTAICKTKKCFPKNICNPQNMNTESRCVNERPRWNQRQMERGVMFFRVEKRKRESFATLQEQARSRNKMKDRFQIKTCLKAD